MAYEDLLAGGMTGGLVAFIMAFFVFAIIIGIAIYVYTALAYMTIGNKLKYKKSWLAWIPVANGAMILQMGGFHWAWIFLILVPILGWIALFVMSVISHWRIYEKRNYPPALSLLQVGMVIPYLGFLCGIGHYIVLGLIAWNDIKK